jgi:hypothetical protein
MPVEQRVSLQSNLSARAVPNLLESSIKGRLGTLLSAETRDLLDGPLRNHA